MSENREEILADFQACTGIDDVAQAIYHLEETNWDLLSAVNRVIPQDQSFAMGNDTDVQMIEDNSAATPIETATDMVAVGNNVGSHSAIMPNDQPSTSSSRKRLLHFSVHFQDRIVQADIPDTGTVGELKIVLQCQTGLPPCQQLLTGWARLPQSDITPLNSLSLPRENILFLNVPNAADGMNAEDDQNLTEHLTSTYTLRITEESTNKKFNLKYPGTRNILSVKADIYTLTDIPVRYQVWSGWPTSSSDDTLLGMSGINFPTHDLTVKKTVIQSGTKRDPKNILIDLVDSDSSVEEFEDASESFNVEDDIFIDLGSKKMEPLIPENIDDETIGCIHFSEQFTNRYGPIHPNFFTGTLDDALKEACMKPAKDRKILALYLHHDSSVLTNVFCTQLLGFESVMQMLENNFIIWGWDVTLDANRTRLHTSINRSLGNVAAMTVRNIPTEKLPVIIIIMKIRSSTDIYGVINGNVSVNELLSRLVDAVDVWSGHQRVEVREEEERAARELVKWEQDQAYRESLEADRAKEEAKRAQAAFESAQKAEIANALAEQQAKRESHRQRVLATLPPEPPAHPSGDNITKIRFRLPKGHSLERRFQQNTKLQVLLDFLVVEGYPTEEYKVISSWPRKDLTAIDPNQTLLELKLCPQETVILEER